MWVGLAWRPFWDYPPGQAPAVRQDDPADPMCVLLHPTDGFVEYFCQDAAIGGYVCESPPELEYTISPELEYTISPELAFGGDTCSRISTDDKGMTNIQHMLGEKYNLENMFSCV
jgi:hypothetical protein